MRVPHTRYPLRIEKSYAHTAGQAVSRVESITLLLLKSEVKPVIDRGTVNDSFYNDDMIDWVESLIDRLKELILGSFTDTDAQQMVERFMSAISTSNRANVSSQIQAHELVKHATLLPSGKPVIMAINPVAGDAQLDGYVKGKIAENVSYIKGIRDDYATKIEQIIYRGVTKGQSYGEMAEAIRHQGKMSRNRAAFIARDQSGTIYSQMTRTRHQAAGINHFQWRGMMDERERASHVAREGIIYNYDTADLLPGEDYGCRCTGDPVFDDELDDSEE